MDYLVKFLFCLSSVMFFAFLGYIALDILKRVKGFKFYIFLIIMSYLLVIDAYILIKKVIIY